MVNSRSQLDWTEKCLEQQCGPFLDVSMTTFWRGVNRLGSTHLECGDRHHPMGESQTESSRDKEKAAECNIPLPHPLRCEQISPCSHGQDPYPSCHEELYPLNCEPGV